MRRPHSQLYVRIYMAVLASLALAVLLIALLYHAVYNGPPAWSQIRAVARTAAAAVASTSSDRYQQILERMHRQVAMGFALYDAEGRLLFSAASQPVAQQADLHRGYTRTNGVLAFVSRVDDAHWLMVQSENARDRGPWLFIAQLIAIALIVGLCAHPVVRRLTLRLERLQASVDQFGSGALDTRISVEGNDEIAAIAKSFNRSAEQIETLVNSQRVLLANASHELRSPLARLRMSAELISRSANQNQTTEINRNIAELDQLIDEILLASRLDLSGESLNKETVDFTALIAEECARTQAEFSAGPVEIRGDARLLRRLVRNLLENAKRHAGSAPAEVSVQKKDGMVTLEVADRGPGIPEQEREKIFQPAYRARAKPTAALASGSLWCDKSRKNTRAECNAYRVQAAVRVLSSACRRFNVTWRTANSLRRELQ